MITRTKIEALTRLLFFTSPAKLGAKANFSAKCRPTKVVREESWILLGTISNIDCP